jgi:calcineurin-like phosphoesterase
VILDKADHSGGTATCENKAVCSVCGLEYGDKLGHDYGEVKYTWTDNTCKAERVCKHDSTHIESETVTATGTTITAATCKEKGKMKYTATFANTAFSMQEKEVDIDFAPHTFGAWKDEIPATTEDFGTKGHKDCTVCGRHFDKDGNEITELRIAKIGTHNVIVNGESKFYAHGESVTVTAEDKEGKEFKGWKDESGKIVSTNKSYTFTVTEATTLTAVYEDKSSGGGEITPPAKKDGLSGGAIAGIVIGSVAVAGIGGFAIFWFAISKKTFADLGVALKKVFTAIGNFFKNLGAKIKALFTKKK